jgi:hypothetical protein
LVRFKLLFSFSLSSGKKALKTLKHHASPPFSNTSIINLDIVLQEQPKNIDFVANLSLQQSVCSPFLHLFLISNGKRRKHKEQW